MECLVRQLGEAFAIDAATPEPPPPAAARVLEEPAQRGAVELQPEKGPETSCEAAARPHRCAGPGLAPGETMGRGCVREWSADSTSNGSARLGTASK